MKRNIRVEKIEQTPIEKQEVELVERKGLGHPDSISDGLAESVSRALCAEYIKNCGIVLHHNTDEVQLVAGHSNPRYGGGEVISPIYILLVGRATKRFGDIVIPVDSVALKAAREYLEKNIYNLDVDSHVIIECKFGEGSSDLVEIFSRARGKIPDSNDTSFGVSHAPLSETETIVYNVERSLINKYRNRERAIGEDIKVMGLRVGNKISLTVANAFVDRYVEDLDTYIGIKEDLREYIRGIAEMYTEREVEVVVNIGDNYSSGSVYLTVTGLSAENGDDGSAGRGNRCNGLITPNRPMSMEAVSGKNPVNHVGKIYNLLAKEIAHECVEKVEGIEEIYVRILSQIGQPIDNPRIASAQIIPEKGVDIDKIAPKVERIIDEWLENITEITEMVSRGELDTF
ncbi:MAG: methionine adenosyltransferase [Candidatus Syntropharchaeia archaeon]